MNTASSPFGTYYLFNHVDLEITYHSGLKQEWGVGFGDNGGRIISAKVRYLNNYTTVSYSISFAYKFVYDHLMKFAINFFEKI